MINQRFRAVLDNSPTVSATEQKTGISSDLSLTVPRYMNQKAFHINTVQEMIHVSRLPFFYPLVYMELFRIIL
jgi:hypothetical protein